MSSKFNININFLIFLLVIGGFGISATILVFFPPNDNENNNSPPNYDSAINFNAIDTKGNNYSLNSDLGNKMIILDFMATWCNPCKTISDIYRSILTNYKETLSIVSISTYPKDNAINLGSWASGWKYNWTFIPYNNTSSEAIIEYYNGTELGIPFSYFIDLTGKIRVKHLGAMIDYQDIENWIKGKYD